MAFSLDGGECSDVESFPSRREDSAMVGSVLEISLAWFTRLARDAGCVAAAEPSCSLSQRLLRGEHHRHPKVEGRWLMEERSANQIPPRPAERRRVLQPDPDVVVGGANQDGAASGSGEGPTGS